MSRFLVLAAASALLAGCAQTSPWAWLEAQGRRPAEAAPRHFGFDWRIGGEAGLAPLQVFDDGERTWLQYPADQPAPAVFERTPRGDRLLSPARRGDYLVIDGVPAHLVMRGGHLLAEAIREEGEAGAAAAASAASGPVAVSPIELAAPFPAPAPSIELAAPFPAPAPPPALPPVLPPVPRPVPPVPPPLPPSPSLVFQAGPADGNIRKALGRWARDAGWVFEAEHWAVDVDIPLAGSAAFGDAFRPAVRALLAATELGERPLQPCFYANRVLRVVPLAQRCDRTAGPGRSS